MWYNHNQSINKQDLFLVIDDQSPKTYIIMHKHTHFGKDVVTTSQLGTLSKPTFDIFHFD